MMQMRRLFTIFARGIQTSIDVCQSGCRYIMIRVACVCVHSKVFDVAEVRQKRQNRI